MVNKKKSRANARLFLYNGNIKNKGEVVMKKACKTLIASALIASMALSATGCSKAAKECKEIGTEFLEAALEREIEDMAELCEDEDGHYYSS